MLLTCAQLRAVAPEDQALLAAYRRASRKDNFGNRRIQEEITRYFNARGDWYYPLPKLLADFAEDFDGVKLNARFPPADLDHLRQLLLRRDQATDTCAYYGQRLATEAKGPYLSLLGKVLAALALPAPPTPAADPWSAL